MVNIRPSLILVGVSFAAVLGLGCGSSNSDSPPDSGSGDTVNSDSPGAPGAGVTVTLKVTDVGATYTDKLILSSLIAGDASCESNAGPRKHVGAAMVAAGECTIAIAGVPEGTYTACAFLDVDGNSKLGPGDLAVSLSLVVLGDHFETSSLASWMTIPGSPIVPPPSTGPYKVGYQELVFTDPARARTLKTALWYPTVDGEANATSAFTGGAPNISGRPYPLILYSHGDGGRSTNGKADFLKNAWASQGFVVVAPDHQKNTSYDFDTSEAGRAAIQFDRPLDIRFVTDQVLLLNADTTSFLHGMVDPEAMGMSGHSFGGHTTLMVAGATPNLDYLAEHCKANLDNWDVCPLQSRLQQLYPGQRIIDLSDPRMKVALSLAGDGYGWFLQDGMAKIRIPVMFMVGRLDTVCPLETQAMPEYQGVVSTKYLFVQDQADHMAFVNGCSQATSASCEALHAQIKSVSIAFWTLHLKKDTTAAETLRTFSQPNASLLSEPAR